ncbi:MAG: FAD-binding protein [Desulfobacterota bacterium]|nr:FAD-binding protein [Thermodesulfobacteriota bacterium]
MDLIKTDVLIVGGGLSGLMACLSAAKEGVSTTIASKAKIGLGTSSSLSLGAFATSNYGMTVEEHIEKTLNTGRYKNDPVLVKILAEEAPKAIEELKAYGVNFEVGKYQVMAKGRFPTVGRSVIDKVLKATLSWGAKKLEYAVSVKLLDHGDSICGAIFVLSSGKRVACFSKAVIMATGGASALFKFHDNPSGNLGDGYALAQRVGVKLKDMDLIQFYPAQIREERLPRIICPPYILELSRVVNEKNEDIVEKYRLSSLRPLAIRARDKFSEAIFNEIRKGHKVYVDLRKIDESVLSETEKEALSFIRDRYGASSRLLRITPCAHFTIGGIPINERCETEKPGLFAAGEVTCGLHGMNRLGGNALTEAIVFGKIAGISAASYAKRREIPKPELVDMELPRLNYGTSRRKEILRAVREIMWECLVLWQDLDSMVKGVGLIEDLKRSGIGPKNPKDEALSFSLQNSLDTAITILKSAIDRKTPTSSHGPNSF